MLALDNGSSRWTFTQQLLNNMVTTWLLPYFEEERASPLVVPTEGKERLSLSTSISLHLIDSDWVIHIPEPMTTVWVGDSFTACTSRTSEQSHPNPAAKRDKSLRRNAKVALMGRGVIECRSTHDTLLPHNLLQLPELFPTHGPYGTILPAKAPQGT